MTVPGIASARPHFCVRLDLEARAVEVWSDAKRGSTLRHWRVELLQGVRRALGSMPPSGTGLLGGSHGVRTVAAASLDPAGALFDDTVVELLVPHDRAGVRFECVRRPPQPPEPLHGRDLYYSRWQADAPGADFRHWREGRLLARWECVPLEQLRADHGFTPTWYALRTAPCVTGDAVDVHAPFGIRLVLTVPASARADSVRFAGMLIHAVVASLQVHADDAARVGAPVAASLRQAPDHIVALLASEERGVLGRAPARRRGGSSWAWSPVQRYPAAAEILVRRAGVLDWSCSCRVFALEAIDAGTSNS